MLYTEKIPKIELVALSPPYSPLCVAARLGRGRKKARKGRWERGKRDLPARAHIFTAETAAEKSDWWPHISDI